MTGYETVVGLEIHVELKTAQKLFCSCSTAFGAKPNTHICPLCLGLPGAFPKLNRNAVECAVKAAFALNCEINTISAFDRKNYMYPDLPKSYQVTQFYLPLCQNGYLDIETEGGKKRIGITRIHIEEDAGKLFHSDEHGTLIDYNRCGIPLIEIVTEPDFRSSAEAVAFLEKLRSVLCFAGVSDCRMNEGQLRCDVNLSVRKIGSTSFGTRTETKNLNSFYSVKRAIEYEAERQTTLLEKGEKIKQETLRLDQNTWQTIPMRLKESTSDYRYFPDCDFAPLVLEADTLNTIRSTMPALPDERKEHYISEYSLTEYDAKLLTSRPDVADFFEETARLTAYPKVAANLFLTEGFRMLDAYTDIPITPIQLAKTAELYGGGKINSTSAKRIFCELWDTDGDPEVLMESLGLALLNDEELLKKQVKEILAECQTAVDDYKNGKTRAFGAIMGEAMRITGGRAEPKLLKKLLAEALNEV
ncbi:MAG: Asp-tRNA(Asn)/Glu-tRNA(Gln) amidotransferase subunit GatB [Oscillospiraceae bacterium]|nr:Asp-tRNA(Asn)/Glu-tRNA(Gln) amidotransferase subunit GatB [Oscillospiraceae bacterium]